MMYRRRSYFRTPRGTYYRSAISRYLNSHAYIEVARGSSYDNWEYCSKEDQIIIEYNKPSQADNKPHRSLTRNQEESLSFLEACKTYSRDQIIEEFPCMYTRHYQLYEKIHSEYAIRSIDSYVGRLHDKNLWIYGPAGTGKTTLALSDIERYKIYLKPVNRWWDGFNPEYHERILVDDFPKGSIASNLAHLVKHWGDRHSYTAEVKNGSTVIDPNIPVIITSNYSIDEAFDDPSDRDAIHRRFQEIYLDGSKSHLPYYCHLNLLYSHLRQGNEIDFDL